MEIERAHISIIYFSIYIKLIEPNEEQFFNMFHMKIILFSKNDKERKLLKRI